MEILDKVVVVIPAYNPDEKLINLVSGLVKEKFEHIVVVNDGSKLESKDVFATISKYNECIVLDHAVNLGKGRALKTAFNYFLTHFNGFTGVVTVDADGQHAIEDVKNVAAKLSVCKTSLVLGVRNFSAENIPFRSKFGNVLTRRIFSLMCGINISDTQTGLRGISSEFLKGLMNVKGERFEYEMNMLLESKTNKVTIEEVDIQTIYIEDNKSSHFNPVVDSIKIYTIFIKYMFSSLLSFGLDIMLFSVLVILFKATMPMYYIISATIGARILSSLFNYAVNKTVVFNSNSKNTFYKYYTLSILQMLASAFAVYVVYGFVGEAEVAIKIAVDSLLFIISFYIQREWVFKIDSSQVGKVATSE